MAKILIPVLPLRDIVVFPNMVAPLFVGREQSVNALNHVMKGDKKIFLISQKNSKVDNPNIENLYSFGTVAKIVQLLKNKIYFNFESIWILESFWHEMFSYINRHKNLAMFCLSRMFFTSL